MDKTPPVEYSIVKTPAQIFYEDYFKQVDLNKQFEVYCEKYNRIIKYRGPKKEDKNDRT